MKLKTRPLIKKVEFYMFGQNYFFKYSAEVGVIDISFFFKDFY